MHRRMVLWSGVVALALGLLVQPAYSGTTGKVQGVVRDAATGEVLPGANVVLEGTMRGASTDENGFYVILLVDPGEYAAVASMIGFDPQRKTEVRVQSDFTTELNFLIREAAMELGEMVVVAERPPVEPDRTTSKYIVSAEDIESVPMVRSTAGLIEMQAGVSVDGDVSIRAGDPEDTAYYIDGVRIPSTDHAGTRVYRDINRLAIQEATTVTGGLAAEYGNAQAGVVSIVTREGGADYHGVVDYQFQPAGQKHWGANVYDSPIHRDNIRWDDADWVGEAVTLPDGSTVPAHVRQPYTDKVGHFIEGNLSGPLTNELTFFVSSQWQKQATVFPDAYLTTPFNTNTNLKLSYSATPELKVRAGGFFDRRKGTFSGPIEAGRMDLRNNARNIFLADGAPAGYYFDEDNLFWLGVTHSISARSFYEVRLSFSSSSRDTTDLPFGGGLQPESAATSVTLKDQAGYFALYRDVVNWSRFDRNRLILKADLSTQWNKQNFVKAGFEATRYDNWYQQYYSEGPNDRRVIWYSKTYNDVDFFPGMETQGVNPVELGMYVQDKLEFEGMIVNAGVREDVLWTREWVTDGSGYYGAKSPMWKSMTRNRNVPNIRQYNVTAFSPRVGISHPITSKSLIRFFYGKVAQFPDFQMLYRNEWQSQTANDRDLNGNGVIDTGERWNAFDGNTNRGHGLHFPPEETVNFELGTDWNFVSDYVLGATTYYKSAGNQYRASGQLQWIDPRGADYLAGQGSYSFGTWRDTRGFEISLKKQFSNYVAFTMGYNLQWAEEGMNGTDRQDVWPDSLFVANGHYWYTYDVDPTTGAEIPVSLREQARREGLSETALIERWGAAANNNLRSQDNTINNRSSWAWIPWLSHFAAEGRPTYDKRLDDSWYDDGDREYWERVNSDPNYPGTGEGNLLVGHNHQTAERTPMSRDRRTYGLLNLLIATPSDFGPWRGQALGSLRANVIYRYFTGQRFAFHGLAKGIDSYEYGPMHDRVDLNVEKQLGASRGQTLTLALEVYNLFNQKDPRQAAYSSRSVDMDQVRWQTYGIEGLEPTSSDFIEYGEINDINNYWDRPRELSFSIRMKW